MRDLSSSAGDAPPVSDHGAKLTSMEPVATATAVSEEDFDFGSDADPDKKAVAQAFAELDKLTLDAERAIARRKRLEDDLQKAKDAERELLERRIPELMALMRQSKCTTSSGIEVSVKRDIRASLPGMERIEDRARAFAWLTEGGNGGVIKNTVRIDLDRGHDDRATDLVADLRARGFEPQQFKDVHASTLSALVRELVEVGKIIPRDCLNVFDLKVTKLSRRDS